MTYFNKSMIKNLATNTDYKSFKGEVLGHLEKILEINKNGNPKIYSTEIAGTGENANQRAIIDSKTTSFINHDIDWVDIEIPVIPGGKARRDCVDLIGLTKNEKKIVLVELKDQGGDNPFDAAFQLIDYYINIQENYKELNLHNNNKEYRNFGDMYDDRKPDNENTILVVAAPTTYWDEWSESKINNFLDLLKYFKETIHEINFNINFAKYPHEDFIKQKGNNKKYTPKVENNQNRNWESVVQPNS